MRIILCVFLLSFWAPFLSFAGQKDSLYIADYKQKLILSTFVAREFINMSVETPEQDVIYMPNNPVELGLGFSWKNSMLSFAYGYGFDFMRSKKRGKTESLDLQFHHYNRKFAFDFFLQQYNGFYMEEESQNDYFELCPDLRMKQYGITGQYVFNNRRFSYRAAFAHNEKQLRSAGSILLGVGAYFSDIRSDSSFMYNDKNSLRNFQLGVSAGYTYTWVINRHWFVNGSVTTGIHFGNNKIGLIGEKTEVYPTVFPRVSIGYDHDNWSFGFVYLNNMIFPAFSDDRVIGLMSGTFQFSYYMRIHDVPVLSRLLH